MTLDLTALTTEVDRMSGALVEIDQNHRSLLQIARQRLAEHAGALEEIEAKVQLTRRENLHWRGAYPACREPLNARHSCPPLPSRANVIANDGSQVPIDRHGGALYYALNVGYIIYAYGTEDCPRVHTEPSLHFHEEELLDDNGRLISAAVVNARRTVRELENLADLATAYAQREPPAVLLSDGPLMWVQPGDTPQERRSQLAPYLASFDRLKASGATLGGYIDRPRSTGVVDLLHLASLDLDRIDKDALARSDLRGLIDVRLFATLLQPGERSALFIRQSPTNAFYADKGHEIWFCYVNVGHSPAYPLIARLEMPAWIGQDAARRDLLHAAIWQQCRILNGYPYVLARAHELALISTDERRNLDEMVLGALRRRGLNPLPSEKAWQKQLTGGARRRHHL